jgi:predicted DsbA family dithiol-disulfide isomerase
LKRAYEEVQVTAVPSFLIGNRLLRGLADQDALVSLLQTVEAEATP